MGSCGLPGVSPVVLKGHEGSVFTVGLFPDGTRIASGGLDRIVRIWDVRAPGTPPLLLKGHEGVVIQWLFPDSTQLASEARTDGADLGLPHGAVSS